MINIIAVFIIAGSVRIDCGKIEYLHQYDNIDSCETGFEYGKKSINIKCNYILSACSKAFEEKIPFLRRGKECLKKEKYGEKTKHKPVRNVPKYVRRKSSN